MTAGYREITDPGEIAGIFGDTPAAVRAGGAMPAPAQGAREITDPAQIASIFGDSRPASFNDRAGASPMASATNITSDPLGAGLRAKADEMLVGKPDATTAPMAALYRAGNAVGMNAPRAVASAIATGAGALGVPGYSPRSYGENYELAKDQEEALARQAPKSALAGTIAGIGLGAVALPGFQAAKGAGLGGQALAAAGTGAAYGAAGSLLDAKDAGEVGGSALLGGAIGGAAAPVISYAGKAVQALAPWVSKGISFTNSRGQYTPEAKAALGKAGIHPDLVPPRQLDTAIAKTFETKGVSDATAREAAAAEFGIPLSRGQATGDDAAQRFEMSAAAGTRGAKAETTAAEFAARQQEAIDTARARLDASAGRGVALENPVEAAERVADQARSRLTRSTRYADVAERVADDALARLRGPTPMDEIDAARTVAEGLRGKAGEAKARYQEGYAALADLPGEFHPEAFAGLGSRIEAKIGPDLPINNVLTPQAARAQGRPVTGWTTRRGSAGRKPWIGWRRRMPTTRPRWSGRFGASRSTWKGMASARRI